MRRQQPLQISHFLFLFHFPLFFSLTNTNNTHTERNLNPKAACLKKRDEEKTFQAAATVGPAPIHPDHNPLSSLSSLSPTTILPHHTLPLTPTSQTPPTPSFPSSPPPSLSLPSTASQDIVPPATIPSSSALPQYIQPQHHLQQSCQQPQRLPFQSYPSPPPLAPGDKIPRLNEHDPPMKHRSNSGTVSPTIQKTVKGRCSSGSSIASNKPEVKPKKMAS